MELRIDRISTGKNRTARKWLQHTGVLVRLCICRIYSYMGQAIHPDRGGVSYRVAPEVGRRVRQASLRRGLSFNGNSDREGR